MEFIELAKKRYSCRNYSSEKVDVELIISLIEAARIAPSAANVQPWHFVVVTEKEILEQLYSVYKRDWLKTAPVIIVACGDHQRSWKRFDGKDHCDIDIAIAVDHITLKAAELGLATCWVCNFDKNLCSQILNLPPHIEPIVLLPVGYPADKPPANRHEIQRKVIDEILHWEKFKK